MKMLESQMFDYIMCPAKYDLMYNKKLILNQKPNIKNLLNRVSNYFYVHILDRKEVPSFNLLSKKYESNFKKDFKMLTDKEYTNGLFLLRNFYNWACSEKIAVIDSTLQLNYSFENVLIKTALSPLSINSHGQLELLIVDFSTKCKSQYELDSKLKYTLDIASFNESDAFQGKHLSGIRYHHVKSNKDLISFRTSLDFQRLDSSIAGVSNGINAKAFYPREGFMCNSCEYINLCRGWK